MEAQELKQRIDRIEECADDARNALQSGNVPQELRQHVETLHQLAREPKKSGINDEQALRDAVLRIEQAADRAKEACRQAGNIDQKLQQAIQRAHDEASQLKKQVQAGSPA